MRIPFENADKDAQALSRRRFIKSSSLAAATTVTFPAIVHAQAKKPIRAVIVGVGGRGGGAGRNFLDAVKSTDIDGKIVAVADIFPEQAQRGNQNFEVPDEKCLSGFDAYQRAIELPGVNYVILATPPGFRPAFFNACVEAGKNVFMEKPVAVDGRGARINYAAYEKAKRKNLKVAAGTQRRHQAPYIETVKRIQDGAIGDISFLRAYWVNGGPIWHRGDRGASDIERQIRNWYHYIWLSGDHICEQHVHNLDVCNWIMNGHPVRCWGMGARQMLGEKSGEIWDNFGVEYEYENGVRIYSYCGQIKRSWASVSESAHGAKGYSNPGGRIYPKDGAPWRFRERATDPYVQEHIDLIHAIQNDTELNEAKNVTDSTLTAIMGREAAYSGSGVEWDAILNSEFAYAPELAYTNPAKMEWGPFRTLTPPLPSLHDILRQPPIIPVA